MFFVRFLLFSCALFFSNLHGMAGTREYFGGNTSNNTTIPNIKPSIKPNIKLNQNPFHIKIPTVSANNFSRGRITTKSDIKPKQEKIHTKVATGTTSSAHYTSSHQAVMAALAA